MVFNNNNKPSAAAPSSGDLLSFGSWEYDATSPSCNASLITTSFSGEDFSLSGTGTTSAFNFNTTTERMLTLNVSGSVFHVEPKVFLKLERLPWKTTATSPSNSSNLLPRGVSNDEHDLYLRTAPELFEIILSHVLYGSFPDVRTLRTADVEELEPLVLLLELDSLQRYLEQNEHWVGTQTSSSSQNSSSSRCRKIVLSRVPSLTRRHRRAATGSTGSNEMMNPSYHCHQDGAMLQEERDGPPSPPPPPAPSSRPISSKKPPNVGVSKSNSPTITSKKPIVKQQESSGRMMRRIKASLARASNNNNSNSNSNNMNKALPQRRLTHAELCASDVVN